MPSTRRYVLAGLVALLALLTAAILFDVLGTVFLAITVAYVLVPLHRRLVDRGVHPWWASAAATAVAFLAAVAVVVPLVMLVYQRRDELLALLRQLPESVTVEVAGVVYTVDAGVVTDLAQEALAVVAVAVAQAAPVFAIKLSLFAILVFALLVRRRRARRALLAPVPDGYHDVAEAFHVRTRETLYAIYVLQAATALGTFLIAYPLFTALGYRFAGTIAVAAGLLQFLPIVGPSIVVAGLLAYDLSVGMLTRAVVVAVFGFVLVAWLPDAVIRPRLAQRTADLPGSLYFIGFTGGLLSLGPIGFIAGPLAVALLVEATSLLAADVAAEERARSL